jgi:perosamine synthetase
VRSGDEVLVPALSFVATANAVCYCGAVPHFIDSDDATLGVNAVSLREHLAQAAERRDECCINKRTGRVIRAIVPMHTFGHPVDIEGVLSVAKDYGLVVVEDAAESLGSFYETKHTGTFGLIGALSFNGNKIITTGGGGAILTGDADLAALAKHVTTTAKLPHHWDYVHDRVAFNYRMPNINAALGCAQLEGLPCFLTSKRRLFERYRLAFADLPEICVVREPASCTSNYWLQTLLLDKPDEGLRDAILKATNDAGLMTRPAWRLLHKLTPFQNSPKGPVPCAEALEKRIINIPSSPGIV